MPHHWTPFDPGNPDCQRVVRELLDRYGDGLMYVGFDGEYCWALYETGKDEEQDDEMEGRSPCARTNLTDEYVKNGASGA
jgi:hypothetical protein